MSFEPSPNNAQPNLTDTVIASSIDGICAFDRACRYTVWNPAMERIFGVRAEHALGQLAFDLFPFLERTGQDAHFRDALAGRHALSTDWWYTVPESGSTGFYESSYAPVHDEQGEVVGGMAIIRDVTERVRQEGHLNQQAFYDTLTGLPNRNLFMDRLGHSLGRRASGLAVFFLDLDGFKGVNHHLGHTAGDAVLRAVAERLEDCLRPADTVARFGGDQFTMLVEDTTDVADAMRVAQRLLAALQRPFVVHQYELTVSASIGVALSAATGAMALPDDLVREADIALYHAKQAGGKRTLVFRPEMLVKVAS